MHLPDRKVWTQGSAGVVSWLLLQALTPVAAHYGLTFPPGTQELVSFAISTAAGYLVPPAEQDIIRHLDEHLVAMTQIDPSMPPLLKKKG